MKMSDIATDRYTDKTTDYILEVAAFDLLITIKKISLFKFLFWLIVQLHLFILMLN